MNFLNICIPKIKNSLGYQANRLRNYDAICQKKVVSGTGFEPVLPP